MINIDQIVRRNIKQLKPYTSARDTYQSGILLDANENSYGSVIASDLQLNRYPDPTQNDIRIKVGEYIGVDKKNIFFGVGSDEIIDLLIRIFCEPNRENVLIPLPTYGMYKVCCDINNVKVKNVKLTKEFQIDVNSTLKECDRQTKIIFLCSPNNPSSNVLNEKDIISVCNHFDGIVVLDEAYFDFNSSNGMQGLLSRLNNLVILRTFSKAWGLAGIRCGYCIADEKVIEYLFKVKAPYSINKFTSNAVIKAIDSLEKKETFVADIISERERLFIELKNFDKVEKIFESNANFIIFRVPNAKAVHKKFAENGIIIRDRSNEVNMENCLRVTIGTPDENNKFLNILKQIL